jgi:hypothetical protein
MFNSRLFCSVRKIYWFNYCTGFCLVCFSLDTGPGSSIRVIAKFLGGEISQLIIHAISSNFQWNFVIFIIAKYFLKYVLYVVGKFSKKWNENFAIFHLRKNTWPPCNNWACRHYFAKYFYHEIAHNFKKSVDFQISQNAENESRNPRFHSQSSIR